MKAKLIMDMPNSCVTCKLLSFDYDHNGSIPYCTYSSRRMIDTDIGDNRPDWCLLDPVEENKRKKEKRMKTKIKSLTELTNFEEYIKGQQPLVRSVYAGSIYFLDNMFGVNYYIAWKIDDMKNVELQKVMIKAINAACNTDFELNDSAENAVVK